MQSKPDPERRPEFEADLRRRLLIELASGKQHKTFRFFAMSQTLRIALGGLAVIAIAAAVTLPFLMRRPDGNSGALALLGSHATVTQLGDDAFGSLSGLGTMNGSAPENSGAAAVPSGTSGASAPEGSASSPSAAAGPRMSALAAPNEATAPDGTASSAAAATPVGSMAMRPIAIRSSSITYVYKGDPIHQDQPKLNVLKVLPVALPADKVTAALQGLGGDAISIPSFSGASVTNLTLSESGSFGYTINADLTQGTFSIYQNYSEWPQSDGSPLSASEVPSTSTIIGIADAFLHDHGIATDAYAAPEMTNAGMIIPMMAPASGGISASAAQGSATVAMPMIPYRPDSVEVLYPFTMNGMRVYSDSGDPIGMQVTVNLRYGKVSAVSGLAVQQYQSSAYAAITDASEIVSLAERPSIYPVIYNGVMEGASSADTSSGPAGSGSVSGSTRSADTVDLGTPALAYEAMYQAGGNGGANNEFLVPAYVFPKTAGPGAGGNVIVPLIQSFSR